MEDFQAEIQEQGLWASLDRSTRVALAAAFVVTGGFMAAAVAHIVSGAEAATVPQPSSSAPQNP